MLMSMTQTEWSDLGVSDLPTGTVTLLLADVEGSTRLWQTRPDEMTSAVTALDRTLVQLIATHNGVRPVEQGEGDSFVIAFARASDAVACAVELQRAPLAPIRLRIGLHTGEVQLRDEGNYIGPTINRTARLRDLAHGGQTVMTATTEDVVLDHLPDGAWLIELGTYPLRDLPRPERVRPTVSSRPAARVPATAQWHRGGGATPPGAADELRRPRTADRRGTQPAGWQPTRHADWSRRGRVRRAWPCTLPR